MVHRGRGAKRLGCGHRVYIQGLSLVANLPAIGSIYMGHLPLETPRNAVVVGGRTVGTRNKTQVLITTR